jgi:hypothetical protein
VLARVLLAHGRPEQAGELLERLQGLAVAQQRAGSRIEVHALQALALAASGEEASAVTALAQAFTLAHPEGYVRLFADEGAPMAVLLGRLIATQQTQQTAADGIPLAYLGRVVRAVGQGLAPAGHPQRAARPCARHRAQTHHPPAGPGLPRLLTAARLILAGPPPGRQTRDGEAGQDQEGRGQPQAGDRGDHSVVSGELARYLAFQWQLAGHRA